MLKDIMIEKKVTTKELSEKTNIPKQTLDQYRGGRVKNLPLYRAMAIAKALNVRPEDLIE